MRAVLVFLQSDLTLTGMRVEIFRDHQGAKAITDNSSSASRSKHIDVKIHFIRKFAPGKTVLCTLGRRSSTPMPLRNPFGERSFWCTAQS